MDDLGPVVQTTLELERLHNARRINAFRLVGLLLALVVDRWFALTMPIWVGVPTGLFAAWTVAAAVLCFAGIRSPRVARAGSVAIPFVDMPLLYLVIAHISHRLKA